jgi:precorrin-3B C17-methyltransferase
MKDAATPVVFARALGRSDEEVCVTALGAADPSRADMSTLIIIGSSETRIIPREKGPPFVYTPRGARAAL